MTLKELIEKHGFGIWLAQVKLPNEKYFRPIGLSEHIGTYFLSDAIKSPEQRLVIGESEAGLSAGFPESDEGFILYQEPKKKKQVYQWRLYSKIQRGNWVVDNILRTEDDAKKEYIGYNYEINAGPFEVDDL